MKRYIVKMESESGWWSDSTHCNVGIAIDEVEKKLYIEHLSGVAMDRDVFFLPLCIREIRNEIVEFMKDYRRVENFRVVETSGMSGRVDYALETCRITSAGFITNRKRRFNLHVSCNGKLNEDVGEIYIGDYIEIIAHIMKKKECEELFRGLVTDWSITKAKKFSKEFMRKNFKIKKIIKITGEPEEDWKGPDEAFGIEED